MLALLVLLLLVLVSLVVVGGLGYLVHRHPALMGPVTVAVAAAGVLATLVVGAAQAEPREAAPAPVTAPARQGG
jgi:hypothetical protein